MYTAKGLLIAASIFSSTGHAGAIVSTNKIAGRLSISNGVGTTLTLNPETKTAVLHKGQEFLTQYPIANGHVYSYSAIRSGRHFLLNLKILNSGKRRIGLIVRDIDGLYSKNCGNEDMVERLQSNMKAIAEFAIPDDGKSPFLEQIVDKSCSDSLRGFLGKVQLKTFAENLLSGQNSYVSKCLSNKEAMAKFAKVKNFSNDIDVIINSLVNDQTLAKSGKANFKIACAPEGEMKGINGKFKDGTITLPVSESTQTFSLNKCMKVDAVLAHEYLHKAGIVEEERVKIFDAICASVNAPESVEDKSCSKEYSAKMCIQSPESCGVASEVALVNAIKASNKEDQKKAEPVVLKEVEQAQIKQITATDNDWKAIATGSDLESANKATRSIASTMSANYDSLAGTLNRTLGAMERSAYAGSSAGSSSNSAQSGSGSQSSANSDDYYTTEEYLADKFPKIARKTASASTPQIATSDSIGDFSPAVEKSNSSKPAVKNDVATSDGARKGDVASLGGAKDVATPSQSADLSLSSPTAGGRQPASRPVATRGVAQDSSSSVITTLQRNEEIKGSQYQEIVSSYGDRKFLRDLASQGVSITIEVDGSTIGQEPDKATLRFIDTGSNLRRVKGK